MPDMTLPLGTRVSYRGMRGEDEDILMDEKKMRSGEAIDEILANCVKEITQGEDDEAKTKDFVQVGDIQRLLSPERTSLLYAIRRASYGDKLSTEIDCRNCEETFSFDLDLSTLKDIPAPENYDPATGFEATVEDDEGSRVVRFGYTNGKHESFLAKQKVNRMTAAMLVRIREVEGKSKNDIKPWLLNLPVATRRALRTAMSKIECGPDTEQFADCTFCGTEHKFLPHQQPGFFFPEE